MKKIAVLTGAGISAESGISTFRDQNGLWENHDIMEVASFDGWTKNPELVLDFYNQRRAQLAEVQPNLAHELLVQLESFYQVNIITQNVDDLHERAGSKHIIHLHGELRKARCSRLDNHIADIGYRPIQLGEKSPNGFQIRPHIVWFGEMVPELENAIPFFEEADIILVIGTSLNVYPAAGLIHYGRPETPIYVIDPDTDIQVNSSNVKHLSCSASEGMKQIIEELT